jgi:hypothetical protein
MLEDECQTNMILFVEVILEITNIEEKKNIPFGMLLW